jgi:hypothetical protein
MKEIKTENMFIKKFKVVIDNGIHAVGSDYVVNWNNAKLLTASSTLSWKFSKRSIGKVTDLSLKDGRLIGVLEIDTPLSNMVLNAFPCVRVQFEGSIDKTDRLDYVELLEVSLVDGNHNDKSLPRIGEQVSSTIVTTYSDRIVIPNVREEDIIRTHPLKINKDFVDDDNVLLYLKVIFTFSIIAIGIYLFVFRQF